MHRHENGRARGSALLMAVVLTSLLAIVGLLFAVVSRMDRIGAQASGQRRQLDMGVDSVLAILSHELSQDVPGVAQQEYYDYPDTQNLWLASLEPYNSDPCTIGGPYSWRQITDLSGTLKSSQNVPITLVQDREPIAGIDPDTGDLFQDQLADADGDGVSDSKWFRLDGVTVNQQKAVYAAVRVIDHGAMVNINTGHEFSTGGDTPPTAVDGSHQMQIDVVSMMMDLVDANERDDEQAYAENARALFAWRAAGGNQSQYLRNVVQGFGPIPAIYSPYDLSDELSLRNRFVLKHQDVVTRVSRDLAVLFRSGARVPFGQAGNSLKRWKAAVDRDNPTERYDSQHLCTTLSVDRLIDPEGRPMVRLSSGVDPNSIREALVAAIDIDANDPSQVLVAAQLAANVGAFLDVDENIFELQVDGRSFFGFSPQLFIRGILFLIDPADPTDPNRNRFQIELYNPFKVSLRSNDFWVEIWKKDQLTLLNGRPLYAFNVLAFDPKSADPQRVYLRSYDPNSGNPARMMPLALYDGPQLLENYDIRLLRKRQLPPGSLKDPDLYVDGFTTSASWFEWSAVSDGTQKRYYRDDPNDPNDDWRIIYPQATDPSAHLVNLNLPTFLDRDFATIGELSRILRIGHTGDRNNTLGMQIERLFADWTGSNEPNALEIQKQIYLDLADPSYRNIFQRLAVPMTSLGMTAGNEIRVKGRINVNTAPALVIDKLPWLNFETERLRKTGKAVNVAAAIAEYRERMDGFHSIGELMQIPAMKCLADDDSDNSFDDSTPPGPDLTPDQSRDDLEERDLLFHRISNLITVRSDVFSAYILVRIGADGPQRRVLAILDRSEVLPDDDDIRGYKGEVKVVALQQVPDPR
ncbi:MAG: hypothetical protein IH892_01155 [Planctomycetes bacterium]|nr:hypothetical protein [Planctomycetota bacterium]